VTKAGILQRAILRKANIVVNQVDAKSQMNSSLTPNLSPLEAWELLKKISCEMYFLQTGIKSDYHVDKSVIQIVQRES